MLHDMARAVSVSTTMTDNAYARLLREQIAEARSELRTEVEVVSAQYGSAHEQPVLGFKVRPMPAPRRWAQRTCCRVSIWARRPVVR